MGFSWCDMEHWLFVCFFGYLEKRVCVGCLLKNPCQFHGRNLEFKQEMIEFKSRYGQLFSCAF